MHSTKLFLTTAVAALALLPTAQRAAASPSIRYGIQDDAWLAYGPGTLADRVARLHALGVSVVRYTLAWNEIARERPANARLAADPAYDWSRSDDVLDALRAEGISAVIGIVGTPSWANGGRPASWAPRSARDFGDFAYAAAKHYPWVRDWLIWNEPNQRRWLRPTSPRTYVRLLLDPAYAAIHRANPRARVAGGVTAPRGGPGGVSPVVFIGGMRAAGARLDVYAHHPYPLRPNETPSSGGCGHCETITMATLGRLLSAVESAFGPKRVWLTEYGYQTNPPDRVLGVSYARQARYVADAALRAYLAPRVDLLIHYLVQDEPTLGRWQSGLFTIAGRPKPATRAFALPFAQAARRGAQTVFWGQVRPGTGRRKYRLQQLQGGTWRSIGKAAVTDARGLLHISVTTAAGGRFRVWSPSLHITSYPVVVGTSS